MTPPDLGQAPLPTVPDSHCHLDHIAAREGGPSVDEVLGRAREAGVTPFVTIATTAAGFPAVRAIAAAHDDVRASVGRHPCYVHEEPLVHRDELLTATEDPGIVAIGESGLDFSRGMEHAGVQEESFRVHIAAARDSNLPLIIHARSAGGRIVEVLEEEMAAGAFRAILHCFSGPPEFASRLLSLGLYLSFSGILTYPKSAPERAVAAMAPEERLLVETDAPYLAPQPVRGRPGEPAHVAHTVRVLAQCRDACEHHLRQRLTTTFHQVFDRFPPRPGQGAGLP